MTIQTTDYYLKTCCARACNARNAITTTDYDRAQATAHAIRAIRAYRQARTQRPYTYCPHPYNATPEAVTRLLDGYVETARVAATEACRTAQERHPRPHAIPRNPPAIRWAVTQLA